MNQLPPDDATAPATSPGRRLHTVLLGARNRKVVIASAVLLLVGALVVGVAVDIADMRAVEAANEAEKMADEAEKKAEAAAKKIRKAEQAAETAERAAYTARLDGTALLTSAASFATPEALTGLQAAVDKLNRVMDGDPTVFKLESAAEKVRDAMAGIGTLEDAQERTFEEALSAAGIPGAISVTSAVMKCSELDAAYAGDPKSAYPEFLISGWEPVAVAVYCPEYQTAVDYAGTFIPEGGFAIETVGSAAGVNPKVIAAGTYKTVAAPVDCYWEINDQSGNIFENNFVNSAPAGITLTLRAGQGFDSSGCGRWARQ